MTPTLDPEDVYDIMCQLFPAQNDFYMCDYKEETQELLHFGVDTKIAFLDLMAKHREKILEFDSEELDDFLIKQYTTQYGKEYVDERVKNRFWFAYPAFIRLALEGEFGEKYETFANKRDGIEP